MKKILLILISVIPIVLLAQERETVITKNELRKVSFKETCEVLKGNPSVKDGLYKSFRKNSLISEGFYSNGIKDSVWKGYGPDNKLISIRHYQHGRKTGAWEFFNYKGEWEWTYNFETGESTFAGPVTKPDTTTYYLKNESGEWKRVKLDKNPIFLTGSGEKFAKATYYMYYPQAAMDNEIHGKVLVQIIIDENGEGQDFTVSTTPGAELNDPALDMVKATYREFVSGEMDGKKVTVLYFQPVQFNIEIHR